MIKKKTTPLPFLLIVGFSLVVMVAILVAQYQSQKSIQQLKNGNALAVTTFKVDNLMGNIINEIYIIEDDTKKLIISGNAEQYRIIQDALQKLQKENALIENLSVSRDSSRKIINSLTAMVKRKIAPFIALQNFASPEEKSKLLAQLSSPQSKLLTDSIYFTALNFQLQLENDLQKTIVENESLSVKVLSLARILGFISIAAIAILASIIIRRLLQNYELIKALNSAKLQAEKQSTIKEQFLANMSHEIRTPVNSVIGFTNLLQKTQLKEEQLQFVGLIKTAGQNLLNIINDILDISKIESGMLTIDKTPFNVRELCYSVEMMFYHLVKEKNLSLKSVITGNIPDLIIVDKERLSQVLTNLVSNAIKFTKEGGIVINLEMIKSTGKTARLRFSVTDTGIGIMPDKLDVIFDRFEQAEASTNRNYGGTGLGLSIVKNLVNMQGGSIWAISEYGKGATFIFEMEFEIGEADLQPQLKINFSHDIPTAKENTTLRGIKLLVAEDNKMNQLLLKYIFEQWQLDFDFAETGNEAVEMVEKNNYDIVLMDIQMPGMDGYVAAEIIRKKLNSAIPIIAMTANVLPGEKEKCKNIGMNDYIAKPLNEKYLIELLLKNLPLSSSINNDSEQAAMGLISLPYLLNTFAGNKVFIKNILRQFVTQYPLEVEELASSVKSRDIAKVKTQSHNMKTTISTLNNESLILADLEAMEGFENNASNWVIIDHKINMLIQYKDDLLKEADNIIQTL
jgi:signal transduction histidine kinase/DNA-binding NarL/FixJ family response regulator